MFAKLEDMGIDLKEQLFGNETRQLVYKSLDANATRSRAIAQNIANAMTPGYRRKDVDFESQVQEAMRNRIAGATTTDGHIAIPKGLDLSKIHAEVYEPNDPTKPGDLNNVDIDIENAKMAENQLQYEFNVRFASFEKYFSAIKGSGN